MVEEEVEAGRIRNVQAIDLLLDIMSLCISTFIVAPMGYARGECDSNARKEYLQHRKEDVTILVLKGISV